MSPADLVLSIKEQSEYYKYHLKNNGEENNYVK